jgi:hypothetical protein
LNPLERFYRIDQTLDGPGYVSLDTLCKTLEVSRATLKRDKRMNIRVSSMDMLGLQTKAAKLGMPYQTLVSSVLHQYLTGRLKSSDT